MKLAIALIFLFFIPIATAVELSTEQNYQASVNKTFNLPVLVRADQEYKNQQVTLTIAIDNTTILNNCYMNYTDTFYTSGKTLKIIKIPITFYQNGTRTITMTLESVNNKTANTTTITINGNNTDIPRKYVCSSIGQRRERYGMYDKNTVTERRTNTTRKYQTW